MMKRRFYILWPTNRSTRYNRFSWLSPAAKSPRSTVTVVDATSTSPDLTPPNTGMDAFN